jgi:hypothetical protein
MAATRPCSCARTARARERVGLAKIVCMVAELASSQHERSLSFEMSSLPFTILEPDPNSLQSPALLIHHLQNLLPHGFDAAES